jgi:hypothetical protein
LIFASGSTSTVAVVGADLDEADFFGIGVEAVGLGVERKPWGGAEFRAGARPVFHRCLSREIFTTKARDTKFFRKCFVSFGVPVVNFSGMNLAIAFAGCAEKHAQKPPSFTASGKFPTRNFSRSRKKPPRILQNNFGVKPGDRVALWLKNCPEFVACVFGILAAGAVVVPVNNFLKPAEVELHFERRRN